MEQSFLYVLLISGIQLFYLLGVFIAVGFLLGYLEKRSNRYITRVFGRKGILLTAWIGTPIHEAGHALMCLLFRHKITKVKFLQLNDPNGVLGYVEHAYNPRSIYQRIGLFFIGLAPVFSGILALIMCMYFFVPNSYQVFQEYLNTKVQAGQINIDMIQTMFVSTFTLFKSLFSLSNVMNPYFWLFIILSISISSHIALSSADIKESSHGLVMVFALLVIFNTVSSYLGVDGQQVIVAISKYNAYVLAFSSIAIVFSSLTLGISFLLYRLKMVR
ncbi:hypothetical protein CVD28_24570 [Bacillus sp. M6-12]|uniref:hypothetical protein n=1 Tax=Bacillus sp. M6-12 TaxID=2054166 RepID=UPI000C75CE90|nr:hypothetical protein [Bacillus sp. M6-12]PLS15057.1 hypothetical protein CVD28_24570 [Bacillus sp. M6-12]